MKQSVRLINQLSRGFFGRRKIETKPTQTPFVTPVQSQNITQQQAAVDLQQESSRLAELDKKAAQNADIDCVKLRVSELLQLYPQASKEIKKALDVSAKLSHFKPQLLQDLLNPDELLNKYATRIQNQTFDQQTKIHKILVEEVGGEETDYESDLEELSTPESKVGQTSAQQPKTNRIFKYLKIIDKLVLLPPSVNKNALTLFIEIDDVFLNTFLCDENFGYMANPSAKDPEHEFFLQDTRQPVLVYERDHMRDMLQFLRAGRLDGSLETIVYSTGQKYYVDKLLDILDPKKEVFSYVLYQNACYTFEKPDEDINLLIKDISRFQNRDLKRSILLDPRPINFIMTPENGYPVVPYSAEFQNLNNGPKDEFLLSLIDELEKLKKVDDVRPYLDEQFKVLQTLKSSKLI